MSEKIKIKFLSGLDKQSDPKVIGESLAQQDNLHNMEFGVLKLRNGFGSAQTISNKNMLDLIYWIATVDGIETLYWIAWDYKNQQAVRLASDWSAPSVLSTYSSPLIPRANIYNFGQSVRLALGKKHSIGVYQHIDRTFFQGGVSDAHFQFSAEMDENETIQLVSGGLTKVYKAVDSHGANNDITGHLEGYSRGNVRFIDDGSFSVTDYVNQSVTLIDWNANSIQYKLVTSGGNTGTIESVSGGSDYVRVNISGKTSVQEIATEFASAINNANGHDFTLLTNTTSNDGFVYINQSEIGSGGDTAITIDGDTGTAGNQASTTISKSDFVGGSSSENVLVCNRSDGSTDKTPAQMATELKTAIESANGHNGSISVTANVDSNGTSTLDGGVYLVNENVTMGTTITVSAGFNDDCTINPPATFSQGAGYVFKGFHYDSINYPRVNGITLSNNVTTHSGGYMPLTADSRNTYYKVVPVFDGVQEGLLSDAPTTSVFTNSDGDNIYSFDVTIDESSFNPRTTALNVYRAISEASDVTDADYFYVGNISLFENITTSWAVSSSAWTGRRIFSGWNAYDFARFYNEDSTYQSPNEISAVTDGGIQTITDYACPPLSTSHDIVEGSSITDVFTHFQGDNTNVDLYTGGQPSEAEQIAYVGANWVGLAGSINSDYFNQGRHWVAITRNPVKSGTPSDIQGGLSNCGDCGEGDDNTVSTVYDYTDLQAGGLYIIKMTVRHRASSIHYRMLRYEGGTGTGSSTTLWNYGADWDHGSSFHTRYHECTFKIPESWNMDGSQNGIRIIATRSSMGEGDGHDGPDFRPSSTNNKFKIYQIIRDGNTMWSHGKMVAVPGVDLIEDSKTSQSLKVNGSDSVVTSNIGGVFYTNATDHGENGGTTSVVGRDVYWTILNETQAKMTFSDTGRTNSNTHPLAGTSSINTKYSVSATVNGRTFGAGISIKTEQGTEEYDDLIVFSELQQPDVIPVSNYIQIDDLQGGKIVGLAGLMQDLLIFCERGIYRLNVPKSDPNSWSLIESEKNLGCNQQHSICEWKGGVFFAGTDNIYYVNTNFEFIVISDKIREKYQTNVFNTSENVTQGTGSDTEGNVVLNVDNKTERLLVRYPGEPYRMSFLDLKMFSQKKLVWYDYVSDSYNYGNLNADPYYSSWLNSAGAVTSNNGGGYSNGQEGKIHGFIEDNEKEFYSLMISANGNDTKLRKIDGGSNSGVRASNFTNGDPRMYIRTGYITLANMTDKEDVFVRRINLHCSSSNPIRVALKFDVGDTDENSSPYDATYTFEKYDGIVDGLLNARNVRSIRVGKRCKGVTVIVESRSTTATETYLKDLEVEID